ncbi:MAG: Acetolactate synthase large subunit [Alphaproteobacteria bacterium ADurb.Bin438]|nr:MAG: Acetolactate synthase large subunit [Alphaproteobacteria bacterium ADurb.Bin438]
MLLNGAQILIEVLAKQGVNTVFGYPGGAVLNIYDELYKSSDRIKHVITAHEQGAVHAADGYARASGKTGVVIATSGPGATNLITGIANAYLDSVPMVAITGNVPTSMLGKDSFQEVDIVDITQSIVKHNFIVRDIKKLEKTLNEAFLIASSGRKGPVLVDIPKNIQAEVCEYLNQEVTLKKNKKKPVKNDFKRAIEIIKQSKKPYIYCGGGIIAGNAEKEVFELSKKISAPIGFSMMGLSAVPSDYELNLGMCGMHGRYVASKAQSEADLVIAVGVRFSDRATGNTEKYREKCQVIHIDIDETEIDKNVKTKMGLCGDVKQILSEIIDKVPNFINPDWIDEVKEYKKISAYQEDNNFNPKNIIETVSNYMNDDTVVATDVGQHQMWTVQHYKFKNTRTLLTSGGLGTMGYGFGAAIGGCFANNKRKTVFFTSDGSFGMNLNEFATAVTQKLPLVIVVLNNGVLGMVRQWQGMFYDKRFSETTLERKTDFPMLAKAFGAKGFKVENLGELNEVLKNLKDDGPCLIDCIIGKDEKVLPMIPPGGSIKDIVIK